MHRIGANQRQALDTARRPDRARPRLVLWLIGIRLLQAPNIHDGQAKLKRNKSPGVCRPRPNHPQTVADQERPEPPKPQPLAGRAYEPSGGYRRCKRWPLQEVNPIHSYSRVVEPSCLIDIVFFAPNNICAVSHTTRCAHNANGGQSRA